MTFGLNLLEFNKSKENNNENESKKINKFIQNKYYFTNFSKIEYDQYFVSDCLFGEKTICNLNTINGDLINEIYLMVRLPSITLPDPNMEFRWVDNIGFRIIDYIEIMLEDESIQKLPGKYIELYYSFMKNNVNLNKMVGNQVDEINNYSNKKKEYTLHIPIPFYFCTDSSNSLPVVKLQNKNIRIYVSFNNIENVLEYGPDSFVKISEMNILLNKYDIIYQNNRRVGTFFYYDEQNQLIHYKKYHDENIFINNNSLKQNIDLYINKDNSSSLLYNEYKTWYNIPVNVNEVNTFFDYDFSNIINFQSHLLVKYITLTSEERFYIEKKNRNINYMSYDVDINVYESLNNNKDIFEVNNNKDLIDIFFFTEDLDNKVSDGILESSLYMNDNVIVYENKFSHFTNALTWQQSYSQENNRYMNDRNQFINMYNFCLYPENILKQSSGYIPMSLFHKFKLHIRYKKNTINKKVYILSRSYKKLKL